MLADCVWFAKRDEEAHRFAASYIVRAPCPFGRQWARRCDRADAGWRETGSILRERGDRRNLWYDELWAYDAAERFAMPGLTAGLPPRELLLLLGDKAAFRRAATALPLIPGSILSRERSGYAEARRLFPGARAFAVHGPKGSACCNLRLIDGPQADCFLDAITGTEAIVTPLLDAMVPINVHIFVGAHDVAVAPPSLQLLSPMNAGRLFYAGCDFSVGGDLSHAQRGRIGALARETALWLRQRGYSGVAGLDMLIDAQDVRLVEINARFQASTCILNQALRKQGLPAAQELHVLARTGAPLPRLEEAVCDGGMVIRPRSPSSPKTGWDRTLRETRSGRIAQRPFGIFPHAQAASPLPIRAG